MRDLFDQGRAMSPALIRTGIGLLGALLGVAAAIVFLQGLGNVLSFNAPLTGIVQISGGLGVLLAVYLIVRLLGEAVLALHRLNDRLTVLSSDLATLRKDPEIQEAKPTKTAATKTARRAKAKSTTTPKDSKPVGEAATESASAAEA